MRKLSDLSDLPRYAGTRQINEKVPDDLYFGALGVAT